MGLSPKNVQVRDFRLLVGDGSSCTLTYSPKSILQWSFKSRLCPDIILQGEYTLDIPVFDGKALIHSAVKYTNLMMTRLGTSLNGSMFSVARTRYFTNLISLSIFTTCSYDSSILTVTCKILADTGSNSMSRGSLTSSPASSTGSDHGQKR